MVILEGGCIHLRPYGPAQGALGLSPRASTQACRSPCPSPSQHRSHCAGGCSANSVCQRSLHSLSQGHPWPGGGLHQDRWGALACLHPCLPGQVRSTCTKHKLLGHGLPRLPCTLEPHPGVKHLQGAFLRPPAHPAPARVLSPTSRLLQPSYLSGVKHLHEAAHAFDVGIYFEANGHGTVLFKPSLLRRLEQVCASKHPRPSLLGEAAALHASRTNSPSCLSHPDQPSAVAFPQLEASQPAAKQLLALSRLINQAVGDALSCVLLVELALR